MAERKKFGVALGGGGAKALIYLGFFEVLESRGIKPDYIAGTSMGGIIGAALALGKTPKELQNYFRKVKNYNVTSVANFNFFNESLFKRDKFDEILFGLCGDKKFEDLQIPFACTAVDLEQKSEVIFMDGPLLNPLKATSAYPPILAPVFDNGRYLVDGGIIDNVPALVARDLAKRHDFKDTALLACKLNNNIARQYLAGHIFMRHYSSSKGLQKFNIFKRKLEDVKFMADVVLEVVAIASEHHVLANLEKAKPEILIEPLVEAGLTEFSQVDRLITQGQQLAESYLPKIEEALYANTVDESMENAAAGSVATDVE